MKAKKGFTLVEIIVVLVILSIICAISIPAVTGYIEETKNTKDIQFAGHILKSAQVIGTKYHMLGDYYVENNWPTAYESVSNVVKEPDRSDEDGQRIKDVYHYVMSGNDDQDPFKAIYVITLGKIQKVRYKNLDRKIVYEWTQESHKWQVIKKNDDVSDDSWAKELSYNHGDIWWNGYQPGHIPYLN